MKETQETLFGKEITFQRLNMMNRAKFQQKLAKVIGGNISFDGEIMPAILNAIGNAEPAFLVEIAKESIAAPPTINRDVKAEAFFSALDLWESESGDDGMSILWALVAKSLETQFGGIVETLGKKFGISVPKMEDILKKAQA
jgi:hypothetical protein